MLDFVFRIFNFIITFSFYSVDKSKGENSNLLTRLVTEGRVEELKHLLAIDNALKEKLSSKDKEIEELKSALKNSKESSLQCEKLQEEIVQLKEKNYNTVKDVESISKDYIKFDELTKQLKKLENEIRAKKEIYKRNDILRKQLDTALSENEELKTKLANQTELSKSIPILPSNDNSIDPVMAIDFLNSIIADLQRKTVEQAAEIERYKSEVAPDTHQVVSKVAPRLFCDICDMFDLHGTDDCPRHETDSPPPQQCKRRVVRPYCETCEKFGHKTADCAEDETY